MGDLLVWMLSEKNAPLVLGIAVLVVLEFGLDIVHDLFMDWFRKWRATREVPGPHCKMEEDDDATEIL